MIKIKIYVSSRRINRKELHQPWIADYLYCVYFFNILIHTVNLTAIEVDIAEEIFKGKKIIVIQE